ncbi:unnamed protein product [Ilex paraguariensis]|uniref:Uncharacterized protein n=1 Tax=Ilex paraguariensis TaxID=185542 RepID=A0ABC8V0L0_9AQUA
MKIWMKAVSTLMRPNLIKTCPLNKKSRVDDSIIGVGELFDEKEVGFNAKVVTAICRELPALTALNLSHNFISNDGIEMLQLTNMRVLVLNNTGINWMQVEILRNSLPVIEELHLMGNKLREITRTTSITVQQFGSLRLINLEDNYISNWDEILKLSQVRSLEKLHLNKNNLHRIWYPNCDTIHELLNGCGSLEKSNRPFQNLRCLLLGSNNIEDLASIDSLNSFPTLKVRFVT